MIGFGDRSFDVFFALWFQPVAYLGWGLATLWRATVRDGRLPWVLLRSGLVLYAAGSICFDLMFGTDPAPPFPSPGDGPAHRPGQSPNGP